MLKRSLYWVSSHQCACNTQLLAFSNQVKCFLTSVMLMLRIQYIITLWIFSLYPDIKSQFNDRKGFRTVLIEDACADRGMERHRAALLLYGNYMYEVMRLHDLRRALICKFSRLWNNCSHIFNRSMVFIKIFYYEEYAQTVWYAYLHSNTLYA